jgi:hypothetical protein
MYFGLFVIDATLFVSCAMGAVTTTAAEEVLRVLTNAQLNVKRCQLLMSTGI